MNKAKQLRTKRNENFSTVDSHGYLIYTKDWRGKNVAATAYYECKTGCVYARLIDAAYSRSQSKPAAL